MKAHIGIAFLAGYVFAYPWVPHVSGIDSSLLRRQQLGSAAFCPINTKHTGAAPYTTQFPYCGAKNGIAGVFPCLNNRVPAVNDKAHYWTAPGSKDIRGPCPGLNTAANHNVCNS